MTLSALLPVAAALMLGSGVPTACCAWHRGVLMASPVPKQPEPLIRPRPYLSLVRVALVESFRPLGEGANRPLCPPPGRLVQHGVRDLVSSLLSASLCGRALCYELRVKRRRRSAHQQVYCQHFSNPPPYALKNGEEDLRLSQ